MIDEEERSRNSVRRGLREKESWSAGRILSVEHSKIHEFASKVGLACPMLKMWAMPCSTLAATSRPMKTGTITAVGQMAMFKTVAIKPCFQLDNPNAWTWIYAGFLACIECKAIGL